MILKTAVDINFWLGPKNNTFFSTIMTHVNSSRGKTWEGGVLDEHSGPGQQVYLVPEPLSKLVCCRCWPNFVQLFSTFLQQFLLLLPRGGFSHKTNHKKRTLRKAEKHCRRNGPAASTFRIEIPNLNPYLHLYLRQERFALIGTCFLWLAQSQPNWPFTWPPKERVSRLAIEVIRNRHWNWLCQSGRVSKQITRKK